MSVLRRREIPLAITFIVGVVTILDYFVKFDALQTVSGYFYTWAVILTSFAAVTGLIYLSIWHIRRVSKRTVGWRYSIATLAIMIFVLVIGLGLSTGSETYQWLYNNLYSPMSSTIFALVGFYIISAAYRAFRARTFDAALLLFAAILVMLKNAPIGGVIWVGFPTIGTWIMNVPNTAAFRGIILGAALGAIAIGVRTLIGKERGFFGRSASQ